MLMYARSLDVVIYSELIRAHHINQTCGRMDRCLWANTQPQVRHLLAKIYLTPARLYSSEVFAACNSKDTAKAKSTVNYIVHCLRRFNHVSTYFTRIFNAFFHITATSGQ